MRAHEFIVERKKKRRPRWAAYGPGPYGGYGYDTGYSGGDGGGGESIEQKTFEHRSNLDTTIQGFVNSPSGKKYKAHDCKTVTRAFVTWAEQNKIPTQVVSLAPPSADFIAKNPRYKGKSGEGDGHIMPIVNGNAVDFTVRQFGINRPFENPLITPTGSLPAVYGKFGYFTDKPEWFLGGKSHWIGPLKSIPSAIFNQDFGDELLENFADGKNLQESVNDYLWHGSKSEHEILYPQQANDTGGKKESNKNAVYATPSAKVAIAMGLTTPGSDTGMFPNDPQMVLFKGGIRKGQMIYLHKVPKDLFIKHNDREWYSKPGVNEVKPLEVVTVPVDKWLHLIRQATPQDLELQKKYMKEGVTENFADGKNPQDKGDSKRHGINTKASVSSLRKTAKQGGRKGQLAHWLANMKAGRAKKNK